MSESNSKAALPPAISHRVAELVAYGEGAIVSRTLSKTSGGTLTAFAFDAGQELSEHSAPFDALVQVVEGELELRIAGAPVSARTGELVLMPAHVPHAVQAAVRCKFLLTMLKEASGSNAAPPQG